MDPLYKINANGFRRCPYNPSHTVQALRFIGHLLKCAEKSTFKLTVCPWNATHHVHPEDYKVHLSTCESQELLDGIGEIAVPDSAYVREHKVMLDHNCPKNDIVTMGGNVVLYYEPINTDHDYEVEVYNRRFQTQEFCTRDIDEFDNPPINTNQVQFDIYGNIVKSEVPEDNNLPVAAENNVQLDDSEEDDLPLSEESSIQIDNYSLMSGETSVLCDEETSRTNRVTCFWTDNNELNSYAMDNNRFHYGRRLIYQSSDEDSTSQIHDQKSNGDVIDNDQFTDTTASSGDLPNGTLDTNHKLSWPWKIEDQSKVPQKSQVSTEGFTFPSVTGCSSRYDEKDANPLVLAYNEKVQYPIRIVRGLPHKEAISQPITEPVEDTPRHKSPLASALGSAPEGALRRKLALGCGRAYQLQKLYNHSEQKNEVSGRGTTSSSGTHK